MDIKNISDLFNKLLEISSHYRNSVMVCLHARTAVKHNTDLQKENLQLQIPTYKSYIHLKWRVFFRLQKSKVELNRLSLQESRWTDTPTCDVRRGVISIRLVTANHTHTWWYNKSPLNWEPDGSMRKRPTGEPHQRQMREHWGTGMEDRPADYIMNQI